MATAVGTPDTELLRRLRSRDRTAWEELYAEYQPRLRAFAYRLSGNVHDADDLVQETFVRAVPKLDRLDPETAEIAPYLFATLRNLFLKQVERGKRQQPVAEVPEPALPTAIEDDPERSLLLTGQQEEVRVANARLQPRQRLVLALRELEDRSYADIGELVGMNENAVAQLIFRARESLRTELRLAQVDPERLPEECRRFLPLLAAHLDGQLKGPRLAETLAHLDACERCQGALADMREASKRYRLVIIPIAADDARAAVAERLEQAGYWEPNGRILRRALLVLGGVAAFLVLGGGGAALGVALTNDPKIVAVAESTIEPPDPVTGAEVAATTTTTAKQQPRPPKQKPKAKPTPKPEVAPAATTTTEAVTTEARPKPKTTAVETKLPTAPKPSATTTAPKPPPPTTTTVAPPRTTTKPKPKPSKPKAPSPKPPPAPPAPDTTAPSVTITGSPAAATATDVADFTFQANEPEVTFACRIDQNDFAACSSPVHFAGLAPGTHTFSVRATDKAGNVGQPVSVSWTFTPPDRTPPKVSITGGPTGTTSETSAALTFSADEAGSTFQCSLDNAAFAGCSSPASYNGLAPGSHTFSVRATDQAGNTSSPATRSWTISAPLPDLVISSFSRFSITVANRGKATAGASVLTITSVGTFRVPSLAPGASATFQWSTCTVTTYVAVADRGGAVAESDESNNTASYTNTCK